MTIGLNLLKYHGNTLQQWRGEGGGGGEEGDLFLWIINGTIFALIKNNLSLIFYENLIGGTM